MPQKGSNLHGKENRFLEMCKPKLLIPHSNRWIQPSQSSSIGPCGSLSAACDYKEDVLDLPLRKTRTNFRRIVERKLPLAEWRLPDERQPVGAIAAAGADSAIDR
jgi:hypothetical protein